MEPDKTGRYGHGQHCVLTNSVKNGSKSVKSICGLYASQVAYVSLEILVKQLDPRGPNGSRGRFVQLSVKNTL